MSDTQDLSLPRKASIGYWITRVIIVIVPAFLSYLTAKQQSDNKASASYAVTREAFDQLQKAFTDKVAADEKRFTAQETRLMFLHDLVTRVYDTARRYHPTELNRPLNARPAPVPVANMPAYAPKQLPHTLDDALQLKR